MSGASKYGDDFKSYRQIQKMKYWCWNNVSMAINKG